MSPHTWNFEKLFVEYKIDCYHENVFAGYYYTVSEVRHIVACIAHYFFVFPLVFLFNLKKKTKKKTACTQQSHTSSQE